MHETQPLQKDQNINLLWWRTYICNRLCTEKSPHELHGIGVRGLVGAMQEIGFVEKGMSRIISNANTYNDIPGQSEAYKLGRRRQYPHFARRKTIHVRHPYISETGDNHENVLAPVNTRKMKADFPTKPLGALLLKEAINNLKMMI